MSTETMTPVAIDQTGVEIFTSDGMFIKQYAIPKAGTILPQHAHQWNHLTMVAKGAILVHAGGKTLGKHYAPAGVEIKAGVFHTFRTLEDDTILWCIHNLHSADKVAILAEHELEF